jgi:hypothetical protein
MADRQPQGPQGPKQRQTTGVLPVRAANSDREACSHVHDGAIGHIVADEGEYLRAPYRVIPRPEGLSETQWHYSTHYHFNWLSGDGGPKPSPYVEEHRELFGAIRSSEPLKPDVHGRYPVPVPGVTEMV